MLTDLSQQQVFAQQLSKHQNIIHKVCSVYAKHSADKEDLFQEVCLQAWKSVKNFKGNSKFSTWLYSVALNTAITFIRKEKKSSIIQDTPDFSQVNIPAETLNPIEEQVQVLHKAIANLNKIDKALVMLYLEDYSYIEIGDILGITPNNVAVKMNRVKLKLKEESQKLYQF